MASDFQNALSVMTRALGVPCTGERPWARVQSKNWCPVAIQNLALFAEWMSSATYCEELYTVVQRGGEVTQAHKVLLLLNMHCSRCLEDMLGGDCDRTINEAM